MNKLTEYTLDVSKWRCGDSGSHAMGKEDSKLFNNECSMCCLGQFKLQYKAPPSRLANFVASIVKKLSHRNNDKDKLE